MNQSSAELTVEQTVEKAFEEWSLELQRISKHCDGELKNNKPFNIS